MRPILTGMTPAFKIEQSDQVPGTSLVAPPSRPPSRISQKESTRPTEYQGAVENPAQGSTGEDVSGNSADSADPGLDLLQIMTRNYPWRSGRNMSFSRR